jgi:alpha-beta hydrolase superfamily lysophospholipase
LFPTVSVTLPRIEFYTACDGRRLALRAWSAAGTPKARIVFLHGITSHGGWYGQCAEFLAARGIEVKFLDRRGSGLNGDDMGDIENWETWLSDVIPFANAAPPTVLCGISWGGKLAAAVARRYPGRVWGFGRVLPGH